MFITLGFQLMREREIERERERKRANDCCVCGVGVFFFFFTFSVGTADLISRKRRLICPMIESEVNTWECTNGLFLSSAASLSERPVSGPQTELSKSSDSAVKSRTAKCDYECCHCLIPTIPLSMDPQCPEDENKILPCCFISGAEPSAQTSSCSVFWRLGPNR